MQGLGSITSGQFSKDKKLGVAQRTDIILSNKSIIAQAALKYRQEYHLLPNHQSGNAALPEGLPEWRIILNTLMNHNTSLRNIIVDETMPGDHAIAHSALKFYTAFGKYPGHDKGNYGLPEISPDWATIQSKLKQRNSSVGRVLAQYLDHNPEVAEEFPRPKHFKPPTDSKKKFIDARFAIAANNENFQVEDIRIKHALPLERKPGL